MAAQLPAKLDEERFQSQRRAEVELLEGAPGLADELAGTLGAREAIRRSVLFEDFAPVRMHDRALRADRHDDQVAVPGRELLQRCEQLFSLGAAGGAPDSLLRLAGREVEQLEPFFGLPLRLGAAFLGAVEHSLRGCSRLALRIGVYGTRDFEQRFAPARALGIQQPRGAVEPSGCESRE